MNVHYQGGKQLNNSFDVKFIDLYEDPILNNTVYNEQLSSKLALRVFLTFSNSEENLHFLKNFRFQNSDFNDSEYIQLCKLLVKNKHFNAIHCIVIRKISTPCRFRWQFHTKLQTQSPTKVPLQYHHKLNSFLDDSQKRNKKNKLAQRLLRKQIMELFFWNFWIW